MSNGSQAFPFPQWKRYNMTDKPKDYALCPVCNGKKPLSATICFSCSEKEYEDEKDVWLE